jgi:hypothetical protein
MTQASRNDLCDRLEREARLALVQMLMRHPFSPLRGRPEQARSMATDIIARVWREA